MTGSSFGISEGDGFRDGSRGICEEPIFNNEKRNGFYEFLSEIEEICFLVETFQAKSMAEKKLLLKNVPTGFKCLFFPLDLVLYKVVILRLYDREKNEKFHTFFWLKSEFEDLLGMKESFLGNSDFWV